MISTYHGNQFIPYTNIESVCYMPETNKLLHVNYSSILKKEKIPSNNIYCQPYARDRMRSW